MFMDAPDEGPTCAIARMSLAGHHHLKWVACVDFFQTRQLAEQQIRALVGSHAACEAQDRRFGVELNASALEDDLNKVGFCPLVGAPYALVGQLVEAYHRLRLVAPCGE